MILSQTYISHHPAKVFKDMGVEKLVNYDFAKGESSDRIFQVVFVVAKDFLGRLCFISRKRVRVILCVLSIQHCTLTRQQLHKEIADVRLTLFYIDDDEKIDLD